MLESENYNRGPRVQGGSRKRWTRTRTVVSMDHFLGLRGFLSCSNRNTLQEEVTGCNASLKLAAPRGTTQTSRGHSSRGAPLKTPSSGLHLGEPTGHPAQQHSIFFTHSNTLKYEALCKSVSVAACVQNAGDFSRQGMNEKTKKGKKQRQI